MHCAYNYRLRNKIEANVTEEGSVTFNTSNGKVVEMRDATSPNVLLVGPYYGGYDPTFTDQYRREATSIAEATGAEELLLHSCQNVSKEEFDRGESYLSLMNQNIINLRKALN